MPMENKCNRKVCPTCGITTGFDLRTIRQLRESICNLLDLNANTTNLLGGGTRKFWTTIENKLKGE